MTSKARPSHPCSGLRPYRWPRARMLRDISQLNGRLLESLAECTRSNPTAGKDVLGITAGLLADLDKVALRRAASIPVLLLDLRFSDVEWWTSAARCDEEMLAPEPLRYPCQAALARELLWVAWAALREDSSTASVFLGIRSPVATVIEDLSPRQIEFLGSTSGVHLRPRCAGNPSFWKRLVAAASSRDNSALSALHVYALQLMAGESLGMDRAHCSRPLHVAMTHRVLSHA